MNFNGMNNGVDFAYKKGVGVYCVFPSNSGYVQMFECGGAESKVVKHNFDSRVNYASLSPNGKFMVSLCDKSHVHLHKVDDKLDIKEKGCISLSSWQGRACSQYCCWTKDSKIFAFTSECGLVMWWRTDDMEKPLGQYNTRSSCYKIVFLKDDTLLGFVTRDTLFIVSVHNFAARAKQSFSIRSSVTGLCVTPNSKHLFVSHTQGIDEFRLIDVQTLVELCIECITKHIESHRKHYNWSTIPQELYTRIFLPSSLKIKFLDEEESTKKEGECDDEDDNDSNDSYDSDDSDDV